MNDLSDSLSEASLVFSNSRSGALTASWQSRFLCSSRDPVAEAKSWVAGQKFTDEADVIILGLGLGYHVQALMEDRPSQKITIIDAHPTLIEKFRPSFHGEILCISKDSDIQISELIKSARPVMCFRPSWAGFESIYQDLFFKLTGQAHQSLMKQAEMYSCHQLVQALSDRDKNLFLDKISIKDIAAFAASDNDSTESLIWQSLRELVR